MSQKRNKSRSGKTRRQHYRSVSDIHAEERELEKAQGKYAKYLTEMSDQPSIYEPLIFGTFSYRKIKQNMAE